MTWQERAACRDMPKSTFFVEGDRRNPRVRAAVEAAKAVCSSCPVIGECRDAGAGLEGVWGGLDAPERGVRLSHRPPTKHGTTAGYRQHYRHGDPPCEPCRLAHLERQVFVRERQRTYVEDRRAAAVSNVRAMLGRRPDQGQRGVHHSEDDGAEVAS